MIKSPTPKTFIGAMFMAAIFAGVPQVAQAAVAPSTPEIVDVKTQWGGQINTVNDDSAALACRTASAGKTSKTCAL